VPGRPDLQLLQCDLFRLRIEVQHDDKITSHLQNSSRFFQTALGGQPAQAAKEQEKKGKSRCTYNSALPAPFEDQQYATYLAAEKP
jgi:hypothetical protein